MTEICYIDDIIYQKDTVLTVGTFDGIHQGHLSLMKRLVQKAKQHTCRSVVVSFDPHPRSIIHAGDDGIKLLTTLEERSRHLSEIGVDVLCVIPFTRDFSLQNSEEFVTNILSAKIGLSYFIIGYDHHFGKNRDGNAQTLQKMAPHLNFEVCNAQVSLRLRLCGPSDKSLREVCPHQLPNRVRRDPPQFAPRM